MTIETGVPDSYLVPGHYLFVEYGGAFGPSGDQRHILVVGPKMPDSAGITGGTAVVNTVYDVRDDDHADLLAGKGSFTAAACRAARAKYPTNPIKMCIAADHASGSIAMGEITIAGTASSDGTMTAKVAGRTFTTSIENGDSAVIVCEKLNLAINPWKWSMAKMLSKELKADYNTHRASAVYHTAADGVNIVTAPDATDVPTLVTQANDIRTQYEAHRVLVGGPPVCHGQADATNALTAPACTDLDTAVTLLKDIKAKFEAHRINVSGAPAVHAAADTTDVITTYDPIDEPNPDLPVVSSATGSGKVGCYAKCKGPDGKNIAMRLSTDATGLTITQPSDYRLSTGGGANQSDYSSALAVAMNARHHYIVPICNDTATLAAATVGLKARLTTAEQAVAGKRMQAVIGHNGYPTAGETICDSYDYERMAMYSLYSDTPPWEIAGIVAGIRCYKEGISVSVNLANEILDGIVPPEDQADYPIDTELDSALHQGLSLLMVDTAGQARLTYSITTRHTDGAGHADLSVWGTHKVTIGDAIADTIVTDAYATFAGFKLIDNPTDPNTVIPEKTITPKRWDAWIATELQDFEDDGHLVAGSVKAKRSQISSNINGSNPNRLDYKYPFQAIDHFLTSSGIGDQVG